MSFYDDLLVVEKLFLLSHAWWYVCVRIGDATVTAQQKQDIMCDLIKTTFQQPANHQKLTNK